jgi:O-antigen/teichoic acid export membrane protein
MFVFAVLFGINLWSSGLLRILAGQQRLFEANLLSAGAAGLACLTLWWASSVQAGVPWLLAATLGVQTLAGLAAGVLLSRRRQLVLAEASSAFRAERPHLLGTGALFLLLQVGTMLGWGSDSVLLALLRGSGEVAAFAVAMRLFQFASQPFAMLNAPLWASYADAQARGDARFVRLTLKRSFLVSLIGASVLCVGLWIVGPKVIAVWTQGAITIAPAVLALFAVWTILEVVGNAFAAYLNGCGIVREQVAVMLLFCLLVLPLKVWLGSTYGSAGLLLAAITAYLIVIVGLYGFVFRSRVLAPVGVEP